MIHNYSLQAKPHEKIHIDAAGSPVSTHCAAEKHVAMVKIGKTGTTTLCSMFLRMLHINGLRLLHAVKVTGFILWKMPQGKGERFT